MEIGVGGLAKIGQFLAGDFAVLALIDFFENTTWPDLVTHGVLMQNAVFIHPTFVPNPNVFTMVKEFALMAVWNRAKQGAAESRLGVDQVGVGVRLRFAGFPK